MQNRKLHRFTAAFVAAATALTLLPVLPVRAAAQTQDEPAETTLTPGTAAVGALLAEDDVDTYRVTIADTGYFTIDFAHAAQKSTGPDFGFSLYASDGTTPLQSWTANGDVATFTTQKLNYPAGDYQIKVFYPDHFDSTFCDAEYQLTVTSYADAKREIESNNTKDTATVLGVKKKITGSMIGATDVDFYKVKITTTGYFTWTFSHTTLETAAPCWTATLLAADGVTPITSCSYAGNGGKTATQKINYPAGVYYLKVTAADAYNAVYTDADYTVTFTPTAEATRELEDNNTAEAATPVMPGTAMAGALFTRKDVDFYRLTLEKDGYFTIDFAHEAIGTEDPLWTFTLYGADGTEVLSQWDAIGKEAATVTQKLCYPAGTYYISVQHPGLYIGTISTDDYALTVDVVANDAFEKESNETPETANVLAPNTAVTGNLLSQGDVDVYRVDITDTGYFTIDFRHDTILSDDPLWNISLYGTDGVHKLMGWSVLGNAETTTTQQLNFPAGTYYVTIAYTNLSFAELCRNDYTLKVNTVADATWSQESDNTIDTATVLTPDTPCASNLLDSNDVDFFKFTLEKATTVTIGMTHAMAERLPDAWSISIYGADGVNPIMSDQKVSGSSDFASEAIKLEAGTYYLRVFCPNPFTSSAVAYTISVGTQTFTRGDVDENSGIDTADAILVLRDYATRMLGQSSVLTAQQKLAADVNKDDAINVNDAIFILRYYAKSMLSPITWEDLLG